MDATELINALQSIKDKFFTNNNMPKLVVGSGLSISYGIQGMEELQEHLNSKMPKILIDKPECIEKWDVISKRLESMDLENSLAVLDASKDQHLLTAITAETSKILLNTMQSKMVDIFNKDSGFKKMISFLSKSCSSNNRVLDIMTSNYDMLIELVADGLGIQCIDGFEGNILSKFNENVLKNPSAKYKTNGSHRYIRLFKPHGSLNWIKAGNDYMKYNDINSLLLDIDKICIVAPGGAKYRAGLTERCFRSNREIFNELIAYDFKIPLIIFGYGFNDEHFNALFMDNQTRPLLVISKSISPDIVERLKLSSDNVAIYFDGKCGLNKLLYKSQIYTVSDDLWNLDVFVERIIA
ncbi:hypothetical protein G7061_08420 [Erysipelothrix sp. HDW6B]|uniref:SIR2 family protein n=1 Tax=Erysipelothrix sp. HDW6B TaxID=2714929 RepID=UPI00140D2612|nr:SIR2 family protein [Erysipelothrix sp. HDW6B]QIK86632.1 hypothetical protein G7061_08420 [Erysipelothrix sp. HDW6B]